MPELVEVTASLPASFSLITVVPDKAMAPVAEMAPVAFWPLVMPMSVFVPAGANIAPIATVRLPLTRPMPDKLWPFANVRVWSGRPLTSRRTESALLPPKKISELGEMAPLPLNARVRPSPITLGPV